MLLSVDARECPGCQVPLETTHETATIFVTLPHRTKSVVNAFAGLLKGDSLIQACERWAHNGNQMPRSIHDVYYEASENGRCRGFRYRWKFVPRDSCFSLATLRMRVTTLAAS